jgi:kynurenine formamidase
MSRPSVRAPGGWLDLSLPIGDGAPSFPGDPGCVIRRVRTMPPDDLNLSALELGSHQGTHVDAPFHFLADGAPIDRIPLEQVAGPAILVDLADKAPRSSIEPADLDVVELVPGDRLVYRLGWDRVWPDPAYFTDMPRLSVAAARWLAERRLALVGLDAPTPNPEAMVEVHRAILGAGTVLLEALAGLGALRPGRFELHAAPWRLEGADGAPCRAYGRQSLAPAPAD